MSTISARTSRQFSKALGQLYIADSIAALEQSVTDAVATLFPTLPETERKKWTHRICFGEQQGVIALGSDEVQPPFLLELYETYLIRCRRRLNGGPSVAQAKGVAELSNLRHLTRWESEVLHRITLGETDLAISKVLRISQKTVSKHVEHILHKLGV